MKRISSLVLFLFSMVLPQFSMAGTDSAVSGNALNVTVVLSASEVQTGELIAYRAILKNSGKSSVQIPADTMDFIRVSGEYAAPSSLLPIETSPQVQEGRARTKTRWKELAPGASVEKSGTFKDVFAQCDTGCQSGSYRLVVSLDVPKNADIKLGQVVPQFSRASTEAQVVPSRTARGLAGIELHLSNPMWRSPRRLDFKGTLRNTTNRPVWIPKPDKLPLTCRFRVVTPTQTVFMRHAPATKIVSRFDESGGVLLHGGDETYFSYQCRGIHERSILDAKKIFVGAEVSFDREFYPMKHVDHSDYLKGRLRGPEVRVK